MCEVNAGIFYPRTSYSLQCIPYLYSLSLCICKVTRTVVCLLIASLRWSMLALSYRQRGFCRRCTITPVITGFLSVIGSSCILVIISKDRKRKLKKTYHRLLLGISVSDWMNSARACTSSFVVTKGTPGVWQTHGTQATCETQGFFAQLGK